MGKYKILLDRMSMWTMIQKSELRVMKELYYEISINHKSKYEEGIRNGTYFYSLSHKPEYEGEIASEVMTEHCLLD
ncbi:unnamed protein product [Cylicostephanus goldi]|uniref:Uncharacterized protein n=1 Tax=Cylicostephanus goldi TaxID=71465 RepID=A0A3P6R5R9_CYLGO|nr:unnamed protein product [Cylicostephanus goldi]